MCEPACEDIDIFEDKKVLGFFLRCLFDSEVQFMVFRIPE